MHERDHELPDLIPDTLSPERQQWLDRQLSVPEELRRKVTSARMLGHISDPFDEKAF